MRRGMAQADFFGEQQLLMQNNVVRVDVSQLPADVPASPPRLIAHIQASAVKMPSKKDFGEDMLTFAAAMILCSPKSKPGLVSLSYLAVKGVPRISIGNRKPVMHSHCLANTSQSFRNHVAITLQPPRDHVATACI
jgi:hypothetical protein